MSGWATMETYVGLHATNHAALKAWPVDPSQHEVFVMLPCGQSRTYAWPDGVPDHSEECLCGTLPYRHWFVRYD